MIELKVIRHKEHKNLFLAKNPTETDGSISKYYCVTDNALKAIESACNIFFPEWFDKYKHLLNVSQVIEKSVSTDGFAGTLTKEIKIPLSEFEVVYLVEKE